MGTVTVTGTIDLKQFWPGAGSDGDTAKIKLTGATPFTFQSKAGGAHKPTSAFNGAYINVKGTQTPVVKKTTGALTVRFQGIDTTELHYPGVGKPIFRQHLAEAATRALADFLATLGPGPISCRVVSHNIKKPNDVFDKYARFVGDIIVRSNGQELDVNHRLIEQGWALPTFYSSMLNDEITKISTLAAQAKAAKQHLWAPGAYTANIGTLDKTLLYRGVNAPIQPDIGPAIMPKLYRRLVNWDEALRKGKTSTTSVRAFLLEARPKEPPERYILTSDKLASSGGKLPTHLFGDAISAANRLKLAPGAMVFPDAPSRLIAADGSPVTGW